MDDNKKILVTGGSGFLGFNVIKKLLDKYPGKQIIVTDVDESQRIISLKDRITFIKADLRLSKTCIDLVTPEIGMIYHLASLVSGGAETDFSTGYEINMFASVNLLEACRQQAMCPKFIFTSSIATFGGSKLPETVDDWTCQHPQNSYGVAKVVVEQLLNDYSRKGYIDGRGVRLPAIVVRDEPNTAASGYTSDLIREALAGRNYVCPVPPETRIPILSVNHCSEMLIGMVDIRKEYFNDFRTINGPNISPSAGEITAAIQKNLFRELAAFLSVPTRKLLPSSKHGLAK